MRLAPVGSSIIGRRLAKSVFLSDGRALLRPNTVLTPLYVENLRRRGIAQVYIQNELLPDLPFDADLRDEVRQRSTAAVHKAMVNVTRGRPIDIGALKTSVEAILEEVNANGDVLFGLAIVRNADDYTFAHSVNVAVLSLAIGARSGIVRSDLVKLGVGAILHDVGKALIPRELLLKSAALTDEERTVMEKHTILGFRALLHDTPGLSPLSANIALCHHERLDGSGYPNHIRGDKIHRFSKIVAVADVWDAMVTDRTYRSALPQHDAANVLREGAGRVFDADATRRLLMRVTVFPTGSVVRLLDGRIGVICEQDPGHPEHPWVMIVGNRDNLPVPPERVRVGEEDGAIVTGILDGIPSPLAADRQAENAATASA